MPCPPAVKVRTVAASATQASPWQKGPMQLALTLRKENETLRGLLVTAQKQTEELREEGQQQSSIDYAHLLDLVKAFGTGLEDCCEKPEEETDACGLMSFNTEEFRMDDDDCDERDVQIQKLEAELADVKEQLAEKTIAVRALIDSDDEDEDEEEDGILGKKLHGYWISSKNGEFHNIGCSGNAMEDSVPCTEWQVTDIDDESVTLKGSDGPEHTVERIKTRMFGETLLWGSGDLWTRQPAAQKA